MKKMIFCVVCFLLLCAGGFSQNKKDIIGTWYAKIPAYQFRQYGPAAIFTKNEIKGSKQQLIIDDKYNYIYVETFRDSIRNEGYLTLDGDTLKFFQYKTNSEDYRNVSSLRYFIYQLNSGSLIYSYRSIPVPKKKDEEGSIFTKVEEAAEGDHQFFKSIYGALGPVKPQSKDSVYLNSYEVILVKDSSITIESLKQQSGNPQYLSGVKEALMNLKSKVTPAKQNGRPVTAYFKFNVAY